MDGAESDEYLPGDMEFDPSSYIPYLEEDEEYMNQAGEAGETAETEVNNHFGGGICTGKGFDREEIRKE